MHVVADSFLLDEDEGRYRSLEPDSAADATGVQVGCLAHELKNRAFVAQAMPAGIAEWNSALDVNADESALYAPMDAGLPADGVLARTEGEQGRAIADLDFDALAASRKHARVANDRHRPAQLAPALEHATVAAFEPVA